MAAQGRVFRHCALRMIFLHEAIYIFNNMLKRILEDYSPEYLVAVWEGSGDTFREKVFPEYKANRERMPESLTAQLPYILRLLKAWNILTLSEDGYEADDTIGLLTSQGLAQGYGCLCRFF